MLDRSRPWMLLRPPRQPRSSPGPGGAWQLTLAASRRESPCCRCDHPIHQSSVTSAGLPSPPRQACLYFFQNISVYVSGSLVALPLEMLGRFFAFGTLADSFRENCFFPTSYRTLLGIRHTELFQACIPEARRERLGGHAGRAGGLADGVEHHLAAASVRGVDLDDLQRQAS